MLPLSSRHDPILDRVRGILIGLAAGDRNGGPVRMACRLAASLVDRQAFDPADIRRRYLDWWRSGGFDTGPVAAKVFTLLEAGVPPEEAPARIHAQSGGMTAGCNPAHRSAPLAMAAFLPEESLREYALAEAALTHWDPLAGEVAAATVRLCRLLVEGAAWSDALRVVGTDCESAVAAALRDPGAAPLRTDGFAPAVLQAAVHFVETRSCFDTALDAAIVFAGPANYCPVLVGTLGGARWGASHIGLRHLKHGDILPEVRKNADALAQRW